MNASLHVVPLRSLAAPGAAANVRLRIGEHVVDFGALRVVTNPAAPRLTSRAAAVLVELARHAGDTVARETLLDRVWKDRVTTPDVLTQAIKELRRAFVDDAKPSRYIETVPKVGYRLLAAVSEIDPALLPVPCEVLHSANDEAALDPALARLEPLPAAHPRSAPATTPDIAAPTLVAAEPSSAPAASAPRLAPIGVLRLAAAAALLALFAAAVLLLRALAPAPAAANAWRALDSRALTSDPGPERRPRISPDGTRLVYSQFDPDSGFERLVVRGVAPSQSIHLTQRAIAHEEMPVWSPDGTRIAFERLDPSENCTMYVVPSLGGAEDEVGPCGDFRVNYFDWAPDGRSLIVSDPLASASAGGLPLVRLDLASGRRERLAYEREPADEDLEPHYSPDGRWIAFRRGLSPHSDLFLVPAGGGHVRQLTHLDARIAGHAWTADGAALVFSGNQDGAFALYVLDVASGRVTPLGVTPATFPSAAANGRVVYEIERTKTALASAPLSAPDEAATAPAALHDLARSTGSDAAPAISPDGRAVAFVSDRSGMQEIWLYALDEASVPVLLSDYRNAVIGGLQWRADGTHLLATVHSDGRTQLVETEIASRRSHAVAQSQTGVLAGAYGPEPDSLLVLRHGPGERSELLVLDRADSAQERARPLLSAVAHAELDRSTQSVYYTKTDTPGLFRRALAGGDERLVTRKVTANIGDGWRVIDGRVWYVSGMMQKPFELRELDPADGSERVRAHVDAWLRDVNFDLAPTRDRVLLAPMGAEDIDVGAFTLAAGG